MERNDIGTNWLENSSSCPDFLTQWRVVAKYGNEIDTELEVYGNHVLMCLN